MAKKKLKTVKPLKEIEAEYAQLCSVAGDKQYRIEILKGELGQLNRRMLELNQEAAAAKAAELAAPKVEQPNE